MDGVHKIIIFNKEVLTNVTFLEEANTTLSIGYAEGGAISLRFLLS